MNHIDATALRQMKSLSLFPLSQLQKLAPHLIVRQFKKNQIIFDQDEEAKLVYLLISRVVIVLRISHEVLASLVGASRQQVTEHLNEFDRKNIISREGRRIVINRKKLRTIVEMAP